MMGKKQTFQCDNSTTINQNNLKLGQCGVDVLVSTGFGWILTLVAGYRNREANPKGKQVFGFRGEYGRKAET